MLSGYIAWNSEKVLEQAARAVGRIDAPRILILELVEAAFAAAVAQRFPLAAMRNGAMRLPRFWRG